MENDKDEMVPRRRPVRPVEHGLDEDTGTARVCGQCPRFSPGCCPITLRPVQYRSQPCRWGVGEMAREERRRKRNERT